MRALFILKVCVTEEFKCALLIFIIYLFPCRYYLNTKLKSIKKIKPFKNRVAEILSNSIELMYNSLILVSSSIYFEVWIVYKLISVSSYSFPAKRFLKK